ncbi:MAG: helix-turn-helix domain-containing protein [Bacteroidales bacterium]|nr:helix-turn-helix domain-containing protein [Bacteroidales bacterium]
MIKNPELELADEFVQYTNRNIFLTGKAGTGKTTFLKSLKHKSLKRMVVVAPTGVAAINAGGVTIHSFFQLPFGPIITEKVAGYKINNPNFKQKFNKQKINIIKTLDLLVIDEISMVRADILDAIDETLRRYKNRFLPFGGVQLLMIGDLQQLAPVVKHDEMHILSPYYQSMYFFNSKALQEANMITVELKHIYRQDDNVFIEVLNEIRNDALTKKSYDLLHKRYIPEFKPANNQGYITLTTHNNSANIINEEKLEQVNGKLHKFKAIVQGTFSEYAYPTDFELELKVGAQVMFVKNDSSAEKRYFNGKIGEITGFDDNIITVKCEGDYEEIDAGKETWENIRYNINKESKEIEEDFIGSFTQYPLRLAWAITIHKSQGLTFEKAVIDASAAFAHGQTYVALSRCKTLKGLVLSSKISESAIICDREVRDFNKHSEENQPDEKELKNAIYDYQAELIDDLFNYKQLFYRFRIFEKNLREYSGNYTGNIGETILEINEKALPKISGVAQSFIKQVNSILKENPDAEKNNLLQERLKKAAEYFIKFHDDEIIKKLENSSFETDNNSVQKAINESLSSTNEILNIKQKSLNACLTGFNIKTYLDIRAKSALEDKKKTKQKFKVQEVATLYPELYARLKEWRKEEGEANDIKLFMVAANKTLQEIANKLPVTSKQLKAISGIGKVKFTQYGEDLISIVLDFIQNNDIDPNEDMPEPIKPTKPEKKKNWEISYEMYKDGKTIEEIAKAQNFVASTIENHLGRFVASGEIKIEEFVNDKTVQTIKTYFEKHPNTTLTDAKTALPNEITWSQLKLVQHYMEFSKQKMNE